jgi:hypothetical protein
LSLSCELTVPITITNENSNEDKNESNQIENQDNEDIDEDIDIITVSQWNIDVVAATINKTIPPHAVCVTQLTRKSISSPTSSSSSSPIKQLLNKNKIDINSLELPENVNNDDEFEQIFESQISCLNIPSPIMQKQQLFNKDSHDLSLSISANNFINSIPDMTYMLISYNDIKSPQNII